MERFTDPVIRLAFARLVTHYVRNDLFLEDDVLLRTLIFLAVSPASS